MCEDVKELSYESEFYEQQLSTVWSEDEIQVPLSRLGVLVEFD